tara:strand:- start:171 stop:1055 length:885 start_codon:yes stop_codon:yes gene_type:complete
MLSHKIKFLIKDPIQFISNFYGDFVKDLQSKKSELPYHLIWCAGLPKSGTTLIEQIIDTLPYVQLNISALRSFDNKELDHPHGINEQMFKSAPQNKYSFLKTHTHYNDHYEKIANKFNARIIVSIRDLRDVMISRYYHILSDKKHWQHNEIKNLSFENGFIKSLTYTTNVHSEMPIVYFYNWVNDWLKILKKRDYLLLWYEDYTNDPIKYINSILNYIQCKKKSAENIQLEIQKDINEKKISLEKNLKHYGKLKSTYRVAKTGQWQELFSESVDSSFNSLLPGPLEDVLNKKYI